MRTLSPYRVCGSSTPRTTNSLGSLQHLTKWRCADDQVDGVRWGYYLWLSQWISINSLFISWNYAKDSDGRYLVHQSDNPSTISLEAFFEPAFTKLNSTAIWIQLHNFPADFWEAETLDSITAHIGNLLKVDDLTSSFTRSRFAWVYLETDLSKSLSWGFWLGDDSQHIFVVVLYEKLPTFY